MKQNRWLQQIQLNLFHTTDLFICLLKTLQNSWFSGLLTQLSYFYD